MGFRKKKYILNGKKTKQQKELVDVPWLVVGPSGHQCSRTQSLSSSRAGTADSMASGSRTA